MLPLGTRKRMPFPHSGDERAEAAAAGSCGERARLPPGGRVRPQVAAPAVPEPGAGRACGRGEPWPWPRAARPARGWTLARAADTRGSMNAMTSPLVSAAQQEMLWASPLPARRKWGSLLPAAGWDLVSPPQRPRLPASGGAGRRHSGASWLCSGSLDRPPAALRGRARGPGGNWPWEPHALHLADGEDAQPGDPRGIRCGGGPLGTRPTVLNNADLRGPHLFSHCLDGIFNLPLHKALTWILSFNPPANCHLLTLLWKQIWVFCAKHKHHALKHLETEFLPEMGSMFRILVFSFF